jgi:diphthine-ammonia ligase
MGDGNSGKRLLCSWSGGKDSCLALWRAVRAGGCPDCLLTMLGEEGRVSRSHGLPRNLLEAQAARMGIPIAFRSASWPAYEAEFSGALREFRNRGITAAVFGDIDGEDHRDWCRRVCAGAGLAAEHPLWREPRRRLLEEFLAAGFAATIVVVAENKLGREWIGRVIDADAISDLEQAGVDPSGEAGEYHTAVTGGPLFRCPLGLPPPAPAFHEGYWFYRSPADWPAEFPGPKSPAGGQGPAQAHSPAPRRGTETERKPS